MKPTHDALLERFRQAFPEAAIQVEDESHLHVGHAGAAGGAGHFRVQVIDARFNDCSSSPGIGLSITPCPTGCRSGCTH
jgi:stress-induced morphogen